MPVPEAPVLSCDEHETAIAWRDLNGAIAKTGDSIDSDHAAGASRSVFYWLDRELDRGIVSKLRDSLPQDLSEDLYRANPWRRRAIVTPPRGSAL